MERYKTETMKKDRCAWGLPAALRATLPGYALFIVWFEGTKSFDIGNTSTDPASLFSLCLMATDLLALITIGCLYRKIVSLQGRKTILIAMVPLIAVSTAGLLAPALGSRLPMPLAASVRHGDGPDTGCAHISMDGDVLPLRDARRLHLFF